MNDISVLHTVHSLIPMLQAFTIPKYSTYVTTSLSSPYYLTPFGHALASVVTCAKHYTGPVRIFGWELPALGSLLTMYFSVLELVWDVGCCLRCRASTVVKEKGSRTARKFFSSRPVRLCHIHCNNTHTHYTVCLYSVQSEDMIMTWRSSSSRTDVIDYVRPTWPVAVKTTV